MSHVLLRGGGNVRESNVAGLRDRMQIFATLRTIAFTPVIAAVSVVCLTSCTPAAIPPENLHYEIAVDLDPVRQSVDASIDIVFVAPPVGARSATFLLHRKLQVTTVRGQRVSGHDFDSTAESNLPWIPDGGRLTVVFTDSLVAGETTTIHIEYGGEIDTWEAWSANVLTEGWTELGLYFPWFPYNYTDYGPFTFSVDVEIDPSFEVRGFGEAGRTSSGWHLESETAVNDIVLLAARDLRTTRVEAESYSVQAHFTGLQDSTATRLARDVVSILSTYSEWFGEVATSDLSLVETKREMGGGYARPGLIVLSRLAERTTPEHAQGLLRYLAHEAAHLWWSLAPTATWEDWLNESFAEYSALLVLRDVFGDAEFLDRMAEKKSAARGSPQLWGFDRSDTSADLMAAEVQTMLYSSGPVILDELASRISNERFFVWCRELVQQKVRSTSQAIAVLRALEGEDAAAWFEIRLRNREPQ